MIKTKKGDLELMEKDYDKYCKNKYAIELLETILEQVKSGDWCVAQFQHDLDNEVSLITDKELEKIYRVGIQLVRIK